MEKYFSLFQHCKYVSGINNGCIYNTLNGQMIKISSEMSRLLDESFFHVKHDVSNAELKMLVDAGMGDFFDRPPMQENYMDFENRQAKYNLMCSAIQLKEVFVVGEVQCDLDCDFCDEKSTVYTKTHCKKWGKFDEKIQSAHLKDALSTCKNLGANTLSIIGGNPFLNMENIRNLVSMARDAGFEKINIYANVINMDYDIVKYCARETIHVIAQVMFCNESEIEKIRQLVQESVAVSVDILSWIQTENTINQFLEKINLIKQNLHISVSLLYHPDYESKSINVTKRQFGAFTEESLELAEIYNTCLYGKIAIRLDGKILPCPMMEKVVLGNLSEKSLMDILAGDEYREIIQLSRKKINGCNKCAFRHNCIDCRALEMSESRDLHRACYCDMLEEIEKNAEAG